MDTVLIGESDADIRWALQLLFRRDGHRVIAVTDGATVVATATALPVGLVVLNLPDGEGPDTCQLLRADPRTADTPIILLSAALYPDAAAAAHAGADAYLTKPFDNAELLSCGNTLLHRSTAPTP